MDDSFISARYAQNFAETGELTWNPGVDRVQGYTGTLLPVVMSAGLAADISPQQTADALGGLALLSLLATTVALMRTLGALGFLTAGPAVLLTANPSSYTHALSGLETMTFALFVTLSALAMAAAVRTPTLGRLLALSACLLACALTRPEGLLLAVVCAGVLFAFLLRSHHQLGAAKTIPPLLLFAVPSVLYVAWSWQYYGRPLPNTFYAKSADGLSMASVFDFLAFFRVSLALPLVWLLLCAFLVLRLGQAQRPSCSTEQQGIRLRTTVPWVGTAFGLFAAVMLAQYFRSELLMNYSHRFYYPLLPLALCFIFATAPTPALSWAREWQRRGASPARLPFALLFILLIVAQSTLSLLTMSREHRMVTQYSRLLSDEHIYIGKWLHAALPGDEWVAVCEDAGAIPYFSEHKCLDLGSLNDGYLVRDAVDSEDALDYVFERRPGAIVLTSNSADDVSRLNPLPAGVKPAPQDLMADARFLEYELGFVRSSEASPLYHQFVFVRRDIAQHSHFAAALRLARTESRTGVRD